MLFNKNIEPNCVYCVHYLTITEENGLCRKKGPKEPWEHCRSFRYDPLKRKPPEKPEIMPIYEEIPEK